MLAICHGCFSSGSCLSPHLMTPAAVGNRDTTAAVFKGLGQVYVVTTPPPRRRQVWNPPPTGPAVWGKLDSSNRACQNPGWPFSPKKGACGKLVSSNRSCQIQGGHFHRKKSACRKLDISNRACQVLDGHFHRNSRGGGGGWLPT